MQAAPPVSLRAGGGVPWRALRIALPGLSTAVLALWLALQGEAPEWLALPPTLAVLALAAWRTARPPAHLAWDGRQWHCDRVVSQLEVMIDLPNWLLLRLRPLATGRAAWVAVARREAGAAWPALRTAVHARPPVPSDRAPATPAAPAAPATPGTD